MHKTISRAAATRNFACREERADNFQLLQGHMRSVFMCCVCKVRRIGGKPCACARVSVRRARSSDGATQGGGRGTRNGETRGRDRKKKKGGTKDGNVDGKMGEEGGRW